LAQTFENYLPYICPRLDGKQGVEVGEIGQNSRGCRSRRAIEIASLVSFFYLGVATASEELTDSKPH